MQNTSSVPSPCLPTVPLHKSCQFADKQHKDRQIKNPPGQHFRPSHVTALKPSETTTAIACCYMEVKMK
jgi:hypothetical protein